MSWIMLVFGAVIGSFLNVCILRIPSGTFFKDSRSICPQCATTIPFYLNIPIFSWFLLRGQTKCCQKPLSKRYPTIEALTAGLFLLLYWHFPFIEQNAYPFAFESAQFVRFTHFSFFSCVLLVCSVIDLDLQIIPDELSIGLIVTTPIVVWMHPELTWKSALFGVVLGGGILYAIAWLYYFWRKEAGLGMGDVKLFAGIGGWLGYEAVFPTLMIASISGAVFGILAIAVSRGGKNLKSAIPFGPFIAFGAFFHFIFMNRLLDYFATGSIP